MEMVSARKSLADETNESMHKAVLSHLLITYHMPFYPLCVYTNTHISGSPSIEPPSESVPEAANGEDKDEEWEQVGPKNKSTITRQV